MGEGGLGGLTSTSGIPVLERLAGNGNGRGPAADLREDEIKVRERGAARVRVSAAVVAGAGNVGEVGGQCVGRDVEAGSAGVCVFFRQRKSPKMNQGEGEEGRLGRGRVRAYQR